MLNHIRGSEPPSDALAAWQEQVTAAARQPWLTSYLVARGPELWPRFAAHYATLQAFPRRVRRALQRQCRQSLAGIALLMALGAAPAPAATIPVGGACTLVAAITAANTDTATGGCPAGHGADTILLPPGSTQTLTAVDNTAYGATGLPVITSTITIAGQGSTIARADSAPAFRIMAVGSGGTLTLQETTVSGGVAEEVEAGHHLSHTGGGVFNYFGGTVTVTQGTISGNFASYGGGVVNFDGTVTVTHSTISGNSVLRFGGGVVNTFGGTLTVTQSTISGNHGGNRGGGVSNGGGATMTMTQSTISGNFASYGGGVANRSAGTVTVTQSTISGNSAFRSGGGIDNYGATDYGTTVTVTQSTISGNSADYSGGGIANYGATDDSGTVTVTQSTISGNSADYSGGGIANDGGTVTLARTLVAGNTAPDGPELANPSPGTVLTDQFNLFGANADAGVTGFTPGPTDVVPGPGVLLPDILDPTLAANGGPTRTHALVSGSPAVDVIPPDRCPPPATDQRGFGRPVDGDAEGTAACDIGAVEFLAIPVSGEPGDLDGDGDVDRADIMLLLRDRGKSVAQSACGPACDLDDDGQITALDARKLTLSCTRPGCATEQAKGKRR
jgi:Dockerin type I domain